jgi:RimJ/RimL family protein N-acetyltransferase
LKIRPAEAADEDRLLAWANDPATRAAGFQVDPIAPEVHAGWLSRRLAEPEAGRIWIGLDGLRPIGVVRVERSDDARLVVSISLDPVERGQGRSLGLLEAGLEAARRAFPGIPFRAWIRTGNRASIALFGRAGFAPPAQPVDRPDGIADSEFLVLERD